MPGLWTTARPPVDKSCRLGRGLSRSACHKLRFPASVGHGTTTLPHMGVFSGRLLELPDSPHSSHCLHVDKGHAASPHMQAGAPSELQILEESVLPTGLSPPSTALLRLRMSLQMGRGEGYEGKKRTPVGMPTGVTTIHQPQIGGSDPASQLHGLDHPVDGYHIGSIAHVDLLLF
jgi:hypothetical protein